MGNLNILRAGLSKQQRRVELLSYCLFAIAVLGHYILLNNEYYLSASLLSLLVGGTGFSLYLNATKDRVDLFTMFFTVGFFMVFFVHGFSALILYNGVYEPYYIIAFLLLFLLGEYIFKPFLKLKSQS